MTAASLAALLNVTPSMTSLLLHGKRQLTTRHVAVLSRHFGVNAAVFLPA